MDNNKIVNPTDIQLQDEIVVQIKRVSYNRQVQDKLFRYGPVL